MRVTKRGYPYPDEFSELPGLREVPVPDGDLDEGDALELTVGGGATPLRLVVRVDDPAIEDRTDQENGRFTLVLPGDPGAVSGRVVLTTEHSSVVVKVVRLVARMGL